MKILGPLVFIALFPISVFATSSSKPAIQIFEALKLNPQTQVVSKGSYGQPSIVRLSKAVGGLRCRVFQDSSSFEAGAATCELAAQSDAAAIYAALEDVEERADVSSGGNSNTVKKVGNLNCVRTAVTFQSSTAYYYACELI